MTVCDRRKWDETSREPREDKYSLLWKEAVRALHHCHHRKKRRIFSSYLQQHPALREGALEKHERMIEKGVVVVPWSKRWNGQQELWGIAHVNKEHVENKGTNENISKLCMGAWSRRQCAHFIKLLSGATYIRLHQTIEEHCVHIATAWQLFEHQIFPVSANKQVLEFLEELVG